jgi:hypothetical protein
LAAACGDDDSGLVTSSDPGVTVPGGFITVPNPGSGGTGGCTVNVSGDLETSWNGPDNISAFTTDYWYTEEELRQTFEFVGTEGSTFEAVMAAGRQVFTFFLFNCQGPDGELVTLSLSTGATRTDFPFGPGTYAITTGMFGSGEMGPTDFSMIFAAGAEDVWAIDGTGSVTISEWNGEHLVGSFTFGALEQFATPARRVAVSGEFEVTCQASSSC